MTMRQAKAMTTATNPHFPTTATKTLSEAHAFATRCAKVNNYTLHGKAYQLIYEAFMAGTAISSPERCAEFARLLAENRLLSQQVDQLSRKLQEARSV